MQACQYESPLKFHSSALNLMLLAAAPGQIARIAASVSEQINELRERYKRPATTAWLAGLDGADDWRRLKKFYNPRTYACFGSFDIATLYLSPGLAHPFPPADRFKGKGQHIHVCLLPKNLRTKTAFNRDFIQYLQAPQGNVLLDAAERFFVVIKLKINPPAVWPAANEQKPAQRFAGIVQQTASCIDDWKEKNTLTANSHVALGLGLGWSELIVVATCPVIAPLLTLPWDLRCLWRDLPSMPPEQVHCFVTTLSNIGYDHRIHSDIHDQFVDGMTADQLLGLAEDIAGNYPRYAGNAKTEDIYICPAFSVYPGHESRLRRMLRKVLEAEDWRRYPGAKAQDQFAGQMGRYDVTGPVLNTTGEFDDTLATIFGALVRTWVLREGDSPFSENPLGLRTFFASNTAVGLCDFDTDSRFPKIHYTHTGPSLPNVGLKTLEERLQSLGGEIVDAMRHLQVPYSRAEQVVNLIAKFHWTTHSDVLWADTITFAPLVLCLSRYLNILHEWWDMCSLKEWPGLTVSGDRYLEPAMRRAKEVHDQLLELHEHELPELMAAFRSNFHHRHLTGYLTDQMPDFNLRYRGSIQQLLNISSMLLDALATVILGERACVAVIGDVLTPKVSAPCGVVVAKLHADTITMPFLLETLAHEVGNQLMFELLGSNDPELDSAYATANPWTSNARQTPTRRRLQAAFDDIRTHIFFGQIADKDYFLESSSDFVEMLVLGYGNPHTWARSFCLRQLLASPPVQQDIPSERPEDERSAPLVPAPNKEIMIAAFHRMVFVFFAWELLSWKPDEELYGDLIDRLKNEELEKLRVTLRNHCIIGPSLELAELLNDPLRWRRWLDEVLEYAPWLFDDQATKLAQVFYQRLKDYLPVGKRRAAARFGDLWKQLLAETVALRTSVLEHLEASLYVRHWLSTKDSAAGVDRQEIETRSHPERFPWRVVPQPVRHYFAVVGGGKARREFLSNVQTFILQRGRIIGRSYEIATQLNDANQRYIASLIAQLPRWRARVLQRISRLEGTAGSTRT